LEARNFPSGLNQGVEATDTFALNIESKELSVLPDDGAGAFSAIVDTERARRVAAPAKIVRQFHGQAGERIRGGRRRSAHGTIADAARYDAGIGWRGFPTATAGVALSRHLLLPSALRGFRERLFQL
jgi:hypothetical protein